MLGNSLTPFCFYFCCTHSLDSFGIRVVVAASLLSVTFCQTVTELLDFLHVSNTESLSCDSAAAAAGNTGLKLIHLLTVCRRVKWAGLVFLFPINCIRWHETLVVEPSIQTMRHWAENYSTDLWGWVWMLSLLILMNQFILALIYSQLDGRWGSWELWCC